MRNNRLAVSIVVILIAMILVSAFAHPVAAVSAATVLAQSPPMPSDPQFGSRRNQDEPFDAKLERERLKAMNKERYENLKKDTDKLLKLATELKESVDKANKDMLSLEVIRKTEEVEKLAKAVREKMKAN